MTQLSKERIEQYISDPLEYGLTRSEQMEIARRLLAAEAQKPVIPDHMTLIDKGRLLMLEDSHRTLLDYRADNLWYWQGDEDDQPELLTCPVMMIAATLRDLLAKSVAVTDDDKTNMLCDSAYVNGLQAGFSMGQMNQEAEYAQTVEHYRKGIREYRAAMLQGKV